MMKPATDQVIFLMGPTASGKTALATELYQRLPSELISVDSALIYQGMDIGTAKPTAAELALAPHHLIDIRDPAQSYSAADFRADALRLIAEIQHRGNIPILVGGTMLYFKALLEGISPLPAANAEIRAQLEREASEQGWAALHAELCRIDPVSGQRIHPNDPQRLVRALEVYRVSGLSMSEHRLLTKLLGLEPEHRLQLDQVLPPCLFALAVLAPTFHWHLELRGHHAQQGRKRRLIDAQEDARESQVAKLHGEAQSIRSAATLADHR